MGRYRRGGGRDRRDLRGAPRPATALSSTPSTRSRTMRPAPSRKVVKEVKEKGARGRRRVGQRGLPNSRPSRALGGLAHARAAMTAVVTAEMGRRTPAAVLVGERSHRPAPKAMIAADGACRGLLYGQDQESVVAELRTAHPGRPGVAPWWPRPRPSRWPRRTSTRSRPSGSRPDPRRGAAGPRGHQLPAVRWTCASARHARSWSTSRSWIYTAAPLTRADLERAESAGTK